MLIILTHIYWLFENNFTTISYGMKRTGVLVILQITLLYPGIFLIKQIGILLPLILIELVFSTKI